MAGGLSRKLLRLAIREWFDTLSFISVVVKRSGADAEGRSNAE